MLLLACAPDKFECADGECIQQAWVCDDQEDCSGGEDEAEAVCKGRPKCSVDEFRCELSQECVDFASTCDGKKDCADGSDEKGCNPEEDGIDDDTAIDAQQECNGEGHFPCDGGYCIPSAKVGKYTFM